MTSTTTTTTTTAPSFKMLIKDGTAKRADSMRFKIEDIHEEPGFNLRRTDAVDADGKTFQDHIDDLARHIAAGGIVPPLEVRPRVGGGVFVVDGHRRRRAYLRAEEIGASIRDGNNELWMPVVAFVGNDADRIARVITSAEGRSLSLLEVAEGYKRLIALKWTPQQIADKVGKTRQHVDQALILANANSDVQSLVNTGGVSATSAIAAVRKHGDDAGGVLGDAVAKANAAGKSKATAGAIKGKPLPRKLVDEVEPLLYWLADNASIKEGTITLPADEMAELIEIIAEMREARAKQASRGQAAAVKEAQTTRPVEA